MPGAKDPEVLQLSAKENRLLLTFDKDFGELVFLRKNIQLPGVILFRIPITSPDSLSETVLTALSSRNDWEGHFSVIQSGRIRMIPLP